MQTDRRLFGPDLVRALAIVLVILSHTLPRGAGNAIVGTGKLVMGYLGVEIFFALSGYLIGQILLRDLLNSRLDSFGGLLSFWKRRWYRTLPNYYLFLLVYFLLTPYVEGSYPKEAWGFVWFGQALFNEHPGFFLHAWSLAIEEWFYLLFPLLLLLIYKVLNKRRGAMLLTVAAFILVPVILRATGMKGSWDGGMRKVAFMRLDALMYGVGLAYISSQKASLWQALKRWSWLGGLGLILIAIGWTLSGTPEPTNRFIQVSIFNATSLCLFLLLPWMLERPKPAGWIATSVNKLSLWSYSMYLIHPLIIMLVSMAAARVHWPSPALHFGVIFCAVWLVTLAISGTIYRYFEKPIMDLRDRGEDKRSEANRTPVTSDAGSIR